MEHTTARARCVQLQLRISHLCWRCHRNCRQALGPYSSFIFCTGNGDPYRMQTHCRGNLLVYRAALCSAKEVRDVRSPALGTHFVTLTPSITKMLSNGPRTTKAALLSYPALNGRRPPSELTGFCFSYDCYQCV